MKLAKQKYIDEYIEVITRDIADEPIEGLQTAYCIFNHRTFDDFKTWYNVWDFVRGSEEEKAATVKMLAEILHLPPSDIPTSIPEVINDINNISLIEYFHQFRTEAYEERVAVFGHDEPIHGHPYWATWNRGNSISYCLGLSEYDPCTSRPKRAGHEHDRCQPRYYIGNNKDRIRNIDPRTMQEWIDYLVTPLP